MIIPLQALAAYRRDVDSLADAPTSAPELGHSLEHWLSFGIALESVLHAVTSTAPESGGRAVEEAVRNHGRRLLEVAEDCGFASERDPSTPLAIEELTTLTRRVADTAEQRGALWLAYAMLAALEGLEGAMSPLELGRVLAQRARVARKADSSEVAETLYKRVDTLGRTAGEPELAARAAIGFGVLAQFKGNLPLAARQYEKAAHAATRAGDADLLRTAQHGRMVIAARRNAFSDALAFGWDAFAAATGQPEQEAEMLINLAQLAFDTGHPTPALQGFMAALARRPGPRMLLPALGGAARAAAALDRWTVVHWCSTRIDEVAHEGSFAYPTASALLDLALATAVARPMLAEQYARRALRLSEQFQFHEFVHHLVELQAGLSALAVPDSAVAPSTRAVGTRGDAVLRQIEQLEGELVHAAAR
jgi:hypothetical protein